MNEHPILFTRLMVRALIDGRKTQTRRIMKYQTEGRIGGPELFNPVVINRDGEEEPGTEIFGVYGEDWGLKFPYGRPGERLWVRETWATHTALDVLRPKRLPHAAFIYYRADNGTEPRKWRPSIFIPRWASRLTLEITNIRVERVKDITETDAEAEGTQVWAQSELVGHSQREECWCTISKQIARQRNEPIPGVASTVAAYAMLWDSINAKKGHAWESNPWVWVVEFKKV